MNVRFILFVALMLSALASPSVAIQTKARTALVIDYASGVILFEKNADEVIPPASMSKLMTLNMVFEALRDGRLTLDERLSVSKHAMSYRGSTMFLNTRDHPTVEELIQGVIILSGNDACVVLAEAIAGSEPEFAANMTARAKQLGMTNSRFANSNGWPDPGQRMSTRDLVTLATRLIREFPEYYKYFAETEFNFDGRAPKNRFNRNPLLKLKVGADGLKTGHTQEAGYGIVGSAVKNDRRVVLVISGMDSKGERATESGKLINWAFRQFIEKTVVKSGQRMGAAQVWLGREKTVDLTAGQDLSTLVPVAAIGGLKGTISSVEPIAAPIARGQVLGTLTVDIPGMKSVEVPLLAAQNVEKSGFLSRLKLSASLLVGNFFGLFH